MDQMQMSDVSGSPGLLQHELFSSHGEIGEQGSISLTKLQDLMPASSEQNSLLMQSCCGLQVTLGSGVGRAYWQGKQPEERTGEGMMGGMWVMDLDWLEQHRGRDQSEVSCMGPVCVGGGTCRLGSITEECSCSCRPGRNDVRNSDEKSGETRLLTGVGESSLLLLLFFFLIIYLFILILVALGLCCCVQAFSR